MLELPLHSPGFPPKSLVSLYFLLCTVSDVSVPSALCLGAYCILTVHSPLQDAIHTYTSTAIATTPQMTLLFLDPNSHLYIEQSTWKSQRQQII